jgi:4-phosphopantoate--beta-alanine ligase
MITNEFSPDHPRAESLKIRKMLVEQHEKGILATAGLLAHGRGEAFDYLMGERTNQAARKAIIAAAATLLIAKYPVISVNGNAAALVAKDIVKLAQIINARIEVNLFHRSVKRENAIKRLLQRCGAKRVLTENESIRIPKVASERRRANPRGIFIADAILIPLEDGDRAQALARMGKKVIAIDLNPLSRTSQSAFITIVDNLIRAAPLLVKTAKNLKRKDKTKLHKITSKFDNKNNLSDSIRLINKRLSKLAANAKRA